MLREWVENKVRDLREKGVRGDEFGSSVGVGKERKACSTGALDTVVSAFILWTLATMRLLQLSHFTCGIL